MAAKSAVFYTSWVMAPTSISDLITDFTPRSDRIDLTGIDADTTRSGNQTFVWVGDQSLSGAGQVGFFSAAGNAIVRASTDADSAAEFQIELTGEKALGEEPDFFL